MSSSSFEKFELAVVLASEARLRKGAHAPAAPTTAAARLGRVVEALSGNERKLTLACHAVFAQAARQPALRTELRAARRQIAEWMSPLLTDLGSRDPGGDLRYLLALLDGLLSSQLVDPTRNFTPAPAIAALLHGLIDQNPPIGLTKAPSTYS
jgi:hypothetical protein